MSIKTRLIIVFIILATPLLIFSNYVGRSINHINQQSTINQHTSDMNNLLLTIELNQTDYVYSNSRNASNNVYEGLASMSTHVYDHNHENFTVEQKREVLNIRDVLIDYDSSFRQLASLNDQLAAIKISLDASISDLNTYSSDLSNSDNVIPFVSSSVQNNLMLFYLDYMTMSNSLTTNIDVDSSPLTVVIDLVSSLQSNVSIPFDDKLTTMRISNSSNELISNLEKYQQKASALNLANEKLTNLTKDIRESIQIIDTIQQDTVSQAQKSIFILTNVLLALTILIFLTVLFYVIRYITSNLKILINATQKISGGQYKTHISPLPNDEFGTLSQSVNQMAYSLDKSMSRQKEITNNLAKLIADRTSELSEAKLALEESNQSLELEKERLAIMAITDELTGLNNRRSALDFLQEQINNNRRYKHPLTIMEVDIDLFKEINDKYGHIAGDEVLRKLANIFLSSIREQDFCARFGGEEFLFIFPETDQESAHVIIERIQEAVRSTQFTFSEINVTFSGGVAELADETAMELIHKADKLLYEAKHSGRDCILF